MKKFSYHCEISHTGSPYMTFNQFYQRNFQKIFLEFSRAKKLLRHAPIDFDRKLTSDYQTWYIFWKPTPWTLVPPSVNVVHSRELCVGVKRRKNDFGAPSHVTYPFLSKNDVIRWLIVYFIINDSFMTHQLLTIELWRHFHFEYCREPFLLNKCIFLVLISIKLAHEYFPSQLQE